MPDVADAPSWRQGYDALERQVGPRLESIVRSDSFAVAVGLVARAQRAVQQEAGRTTRRFLHQLNLPAGSDVSRILNEIGLLRRQVRELTAELEDTKAALAAAQPDRRAAARRSPSRKAPAPKTAARKRGAARGARTGP